MTENNSIGSIRLAVARWLYVSRGNRPYREFESFYGEPAWDMMLDLYIAHLIGQRTAVSSACLAARVPSTTALRYIKSLCAKGLAYRIPDDHDRRRLWLQLSPRAIQAMDAYVDGVASEMRAISHRDPEPAQSRWDLRGVASNAASNAA